MVKKQIPIVKFSELRSALNGYARVVIYQYQVRNFKLGTTDTPSANLAANYLVEVQEGKVKNG